MKLCKWETTLEVVGIGCINQKLVEGKRVTLSKVSYIHGLNINLISLESLDDSGCVRLLRKEASMFIRMKLCFVQH